MTPAFDGKSAAETTISDQEVEKLPTKPFKAVRVMSTRSACGGQASFSDHHLSKGAVDVYADYASHARLPCP